MVGVGQQSEGGGHDRRGERRDRGAVSVHVARDHLPRWRSSRVDWVKKRNFNCGSFDEVFNGIGNQSLVITNRNV